VMREKEYLVAITARDGLLRAETMRFSDELRNAADLGLTRPPEPDEKQVRAFELQIDKLKTKTFDAADLEDAQALELQRLIEKKRKAGKDVIAAPAETEPEDGGSAEIVDLMKYLKASVAGEQSAPRERKQPMAAKRKPTTKAKTTKRKKSATRKP